MTLKKHLFTLLLLFSCAYLMAQDRVVTGKVLSAKTNKGLAGASILVKGTKRGTSTDENGSFSISVPSGPQTLVISSVESASKEVKVAAGETMVSVSLEEGNGQLGEVVVTALGITREKKTLVYATQAVKPSELTEARDPNNVLNSLSGKVANAVINQGSGGPGSGVRLVLRGNRSIQGSNNALIVVDGVPLSNNTNGTAGSDFGSVQGSDGASSINPDDIESVNVLRGASAAALYGSQAGNGVIVITTKKGKKDRVAVTLNTGVAVESVFALPDFQNSYGQGNGGVLKDTLISGESWGAKMTGQPITTHLLQPGTYSPQPNNVKDFFNDGVSYNNSIGVSGGTEKMQTYLSYTNNNITGIIPGNSLNRHTVNLRLSNQIGKRFSTDAKITYLNQDIKNRPRTGEENAPVIDIYNMARNISTADAKNYEMMNNVGIPTPTFFPSTLSSIYQNPYWVTNRTHINESRDRIIGFITAKYKITDWLTLSGKANLDKTFDRGESQYSEGTILWGKPGGDYQKNNIMVTEKWFDAMLDGANKITNDLKINYRIGGIFQDSKYDADFSSANGLNITNKFSMNFAKAPAVSASYTQVQTQSVFGQANLSYKDAIYLDMSLRNDWDSRLPKPYSFLYPSVGVSALLSELITLPTAISFLKASVNYAEVGNGGKFGLLNSVYNYGQGAGNGFLQRSSTLPLPGLKPEIVKNLEFGIEARFLQNRIGFTATYYKSNSFNQLLQVALPVATGYSNKYINAGNIQNSGFELVITGSPIQKKDFKWDLTLNMAMNTNKVISLSDEVKIFYLGGGYGRSATPVVEEGKPYGDLLAFKWATDAKGNYIVDATNGKPVLTGDQQYIGNFNPKATFGFSNTFEYKGFYLRLLIDGRVGGTMVSGTEMNLAFSGIPAVTENYREGGWSLGGVDANGAPVTKTISAQDFWQVASGKRYGAGDFFAYDATNFRVREFSLGYGIPIKNTDIVKSARLSFVARNVFWIFRGDSKMNIPGLGTRKMWFDPDMSLGNGNYQGVEYGTLPATRSLGLNLQVTF
ncbi:SusC/RagA family TonB-linked outer membrane protein [Flavihumibacter profundi]|uniref:SusC/RagA family TonB-linked outer membrane protein n=1 Tax=Flavihumibacter profundi TaxID=2716883 RepID=UPI001CC71833|nr:SusC/RagA family TonB-linked outer membrane protein [Flavihumibacter profundi]MBZ5855597.1 SusC/RagA family TonB-linked outer membrane protein [Flavihumibacter profundi]